jgi:glycosyltransferase involved in cell wall biosynthesis
MHALLAEEKERNPEWAVTLGSFKDSPQKLNRKDEELQMADTIFVASSFTLKTLKDYPGSLQQVQVIPYGFPPARPKVYRPITGKLKLLFVGGLSQRKGLSYLFKAVEALKDHVELTVLGNGDVENCRPLREALSRHNWIQTLPHDKVLQLMRENDVLVFPSLFEGFGQVITEAMAQGTPVITTERTAGPDIITHGKNGWLVEGGNVDALQHCIETLLHQPAVIEEAGFMAVKKAEERTWEMYGRELAAAINE